MAVRFFAGWRSAGESAGPTRVDRRHGRNTGGPGSGVTTAATPNGRPPGGKAYRSAHIPAFLIKWDSFGPDCVGGSLQITKRCPIHLAACYPPVCSRAASGTLIVNPGNLALPKPAEERGLPRSPPASQGLKTKRGRLSVAGTANQRGSRPEPHDSPTLKYAQTDDNSRAGNDVPDLPEGA